MFTFFLLITSLGALSAQSQSTTEGQNEKMVTNNTELNESHFSGFGFSAEATFTRDNLANPTNESELENRFNYNDNRNEEDATCEQVFFDYTQTEVIGFSDGVFGVYKAANDIIIPAGESFTLQTMTFDMVTLGGEPTVFDLEIYEDNGSGDVGESTGIIHSFDSTNMTFVETGTFTIFPKYSVTLTLPEIVLTADESENTHFWLAIASGPSTTNKHAYWISYNYDSTGASHPTWQFSYEDDRHPYTRVDDDGGVWNYESIMSVFGICNTGGSMGVKDQLTSNFKIYPNPTTGLINFKSDKNISKIDIYGQDGKHIKQMQNLSVDQIDLSGMIKGVYIVQVVFEDGSNESYKILKK